MTQQYKLKDSLARLDTMLGDQPMNARGKLPKIEDLESGKEYETLLTVVYVKVDAANPKERRAFYSEVLNICREYNIFYYGKILCFDNDAIELTFNTLFKSDMVCVTDIVEKIRALSRVIEKKTKDGFRITICADYGEAEVMSFSGSSMLFCDGSVYDSAWAMLDRTGDHFRVSHTIYGNLLPPNSNLFWPVNDGSGEYESGIINIFMKNWVTE